MSEFFFHLMENISMSTSQITGRTVCVYLHLGSNYLNGIFNKLETVSTAIITGETTESRKKTTTTIVHQSDSTAAHSTSKMASSYIEM